MNSLITIHSRTLKRSRRVDCGVLVECYSCLESNEEKNRINEHSAQNFTSAVTSSFVRYPTKHDEKKYILQSQSIHCWFLSSNKIIHTTLIVRLRIFINIILLSMYVMLCSNVQPKKSSLWRFIFFNFRLYL